MKSDTYPKVSTTVSKLGSDIGTVNLPPVLTCRRGAPCVKGCYAKEGRFSFPSVKTSLQRNYEAYKADPQKYFEVIHAQLLLHDFKYFRWHSSGDIPDERYLEGMCWLAEQHPEIKFLCFTKQYEIVNTYLTKRKKPDNLILVFSNWGEFVCDNPHNLPTSWVRFKIKICSIPDNAIECNGNCAECVITEASCWDMKQGDAVVFDYHGKTKEENL